MDSQTSNFRSLYVNELSDCDANVYDDIIVNSVSCPARIVSDSQIVPLLKNNLSSQYANLPCDTLENNLNRAVEARFHRQPVWARDLTEFLYASNYSRPVPVVTQCACVKQKSCFRFGLCWFKLSICLMFTLALTVSLALSVIFLPSFYGLDWNFSFSHYPENGTVLQYGYSYCHCFLQVVTHTSPMVRVHLRELGKWKVSECLGDNFVCYPYY